MHKGLGKSLISRRVNLMELELERADKIMFTQISNLLRVIIAVINFDFIVLLLFEVEVDCDFLDPAWAQIIMDHLCLAKFLPHSP